jgi:hypothetical protein
MINIMGIVPELKGRCMPHIEVTAAKARREFGPRPDLLLQLICLPWLISVGFPSATDAGFTHFAAFIGLLYTYYKLFQYPERQG